MSTNGKSEAVPFWRRVLRFVDGCFNVLIGLLEGLVVLALFASVLLALAGSIAAVITRMQDHTATWPIDFARELREVVASISENWKAALFLAVVLFYRPIRRLIERMKRLWVMDFEVPVEDPTPPQPIPRAKDSRIDQKGGSGG